VKQLAFMIAMTFLGTAGVFLWDPFLGVFVYYLFAVLRPQYMWQWSLPRDISWSFYVAVATIAAAVLGFRGLANNNENVPDVPPVSHRFSYAHFAVLGFGCWILLTCLTAQNTDVAWLWFEEYLKIFIMFGVSSFLIRSVKQIGALFIMTAVVLAYIAYEVNYLYFINGYLGIDKNGYGGLDNNGAGLMLAMGTPLCWYCYELLPSKLHDGMSARVRQWFWALRWVRFGFPLLIPVIVHAVLMTYSRGAMLSLIVTCPLLWWRSRQKTLLSIALGSFVVFAIPVMAGAEIRARFLTLTNSDVDDSANSRKGSWNAAWEIAKDHPLFGVGVRNANLFSFQYGADMEGRTIHSQYFQTLADNGFPGLGFYLLMYFTAWLSLRRCRLFVKGRDDPTAKTIAACASGIECSMFLYMFGSAFLSLEVFELPYLLLLLSAQLAVVSGALSKDHNPLGADPIVLPAQDHAPHFQPTSFSDRNQPWATPSQMG